MKLPPGFRQHLENVSQYDTAELSDMIIRNDLPLKLREYYFGPSSLLMPATYVLDYTQKRYIQTNDQMSRISGYQNRYFLEGGLEFGIGLWNKDDLKIFSEDILKENLRFLKETPVAEHGNYIFSCNYRVKVKDGGYRNLLQRSVFLQSSETGAPLLTLGFLTDITHLTSRFQICHTIERAASFPGTAVTPPVIRKWYYPDQADKHLTKRQVEIIKWLFEGYTSEKIARQLHLSVNTVNNHRRHILKLTNCTNSVELMRYAFENGYL